GRPAVAGDVVVVERVQDRVVGVATAGDQEVAVDDARARAAQGVWHRCLGRVAARDRVELPGGVEGRADVAGRIAAGQVDLAGVVARGHARPHVGQGGPGREGV